MRYLGATKKQRAYAMGVLDNHKSRRQVALEAGYSKTMADNPKQIEESVGFKLAMAKQAYQAGMLVSGMMNEIEARGFKDYSTQDLMRGLDTISKVFERFAPKETTKDEGMSKAFSTIIDITPLQNKDNTPDTIDSTDSILDSNTV